MVQIYSHHGGRPAVETSRYGVDATILKELNAD